MEPFKILNDRYYLLTVIRRGGFGTVYKGRDSVLGKDVAVKEINSDLVDDAWFVDRFRNEARHVAKMNHQNIVHIFDLVESDEGHYYIVMEYIDGMDLGTLLRECRTASTRLPHHLAVHIVAETCKALDYAHNCRNFDNNEPLNLVHQDISPGNIMVSKAGTVKLIDFGIAGAPKPTATDDDTLALQGKVQYMSPEQVSVGQQLDKRSDIFSLGLVLYELLEGKRYFHDQDAATIIATLNNGKLKLKELSHTPKPLQKVLGRAMEKYPDNRYQNANQFYIDLVTYLALNSDTSDFDAELSQFIAGLSGVDGLDTQPAATLDITEADALFDSVQADIEQAQTDAQPDEPAGDVLGADDLGESLPSLPGLAPSSSKPVQPPPVPARPPEYFEVGDEIKTVIDVIRLSTRGHKKTITRSLIATAAAVFLFFVIDIFSQWTSMGTGVYDYLFPPTIRVASVPAGAKVYLNDAAIPGVTPLAIDGIEPGVYQLKLTLDPYKPIVKSLHVPGKGQAEIKGEDVRSGDQPYAFSFKTTLELESVPPGADVYINGIKYGLQTPCSVTWEVGEPCEIRMTKKGFSDLAGFAFAGESMREEIDDRRLWRFEAVEDPSPRYKVRGLFGKFVTVNSTPSRAAIYLDGANDPVGTTGDGAQLFLMAARHTLVLKKKGYNVRTINISVNDGTPEKVSALLTRPVRFSAYDATNGKNKDLGASLKRLVRNGKTVSSGKRTPFTLNLQPRLYTATFSRPGFKDARVDISPRDRAVTVRLEPVASRFSVVVLDKASGKPLSNVEVRFRGLDEPATPESVDVTDMDGTVSGQVEPGLYLFRTSKIEYEYQEQSVAIRSGGMTLIEFNLARN